MPMSTRLETLHGRLSYRLSSRRRLRASRQGQAPAFRRGVYDSRSDSIVRKQAGFKKTTACMRDNASCYNAESRALIVERDSQMSNTDQAIQAQTLYQDALLRKANVVGVAVGYKEAKGAVSGDVALVMLVEQKKPLAALSAEDVVPPEVDG